jgi:hypothetical protein
MGKARLFSQLIAGDGTIKATKLGADVPITENVATADNLPPSASIGEQAFVEDTNRLYIWNGSGWYNIALINTSPTWDSGGQPSGSYVLDADSPQDATIITLAASDPEGLPIQYSYVTSGSMDSMATISQDSSVFTITPKTINEVGGEAVELTGSITFRASDGVNILPQVSSFTLSFVTIIENSRYTTLLATAVDTSDNNNITDASSSNHAITAAGDAHAGTFSPYRHGGYSTYFPDSGWGPYTDNVIAPSSDFAFGTGAFTVSFWYKFEHSFSSEIFDTRQTSVNMNGFRIWIGPAGGATVYYATSTVLTATTTAAVGVWGHICVTRDGSGNLKIFLNGTQAASITDNNNYTAQGLNIGNSNGGTNDFRGWMKDIHVVKGYSYEPDTTSIYSPAQVGVGTVFLGCTTASMRDVSTAARTISSSTGFTYTTEVPNNNIEYSAAVHGGSIYFDGTDDALEISDNADFDLSGGSWTIECWWYPLVVNTYDGIFNQWNGATVASGRNINVTWESNRLYLFGYDGGTFISSIYHDVTAAQLQNRWNHVAAVFDGTKTELYLNGEASGRPYVSSNNLSKDVASEPFRVAKHHRLTSYYYNNSYVSDLRLVKGTAVYTGNFTPPTGPLTTTGGTYPSTTNVNTSITAGHTKLHIKGTAASIIDKSQGSNLKLVGNTTGSTAQAKFANTKSMYFDGTGDYVTIPNFEDIGSGNFTIEMFIYQTASGFYSNLFSTVANTATSNGLRISTGNNNNTLQVASAGSALINASSAFNNSTWNHIALVRSGTTLTLYLNGSSVGSATNSQSFVSDTFYIGDVTGTGSPYPFTGYIQDLRLTKGLARYTANFTPPTALLKG